MQKIALFAAAAASLVAVPALAQGRHAMKVGQTRAHVLAAAQKKFARFDTNGDGTIDVAEITAALQARAAQSGKTVRPKLAMRTVRQNDANHDGKVTLAEYQAAAAARFDRADTNKNGVIDAAEVASPAATGTPATTG